MTEYERCIYEFFDGSMPSASILHEGPQQFISLASER
jgi:hypothetical protein